MVGARIALIVGLGAVVVGAAIGVPIGLAAGFAGGWLDDAMSAAMDILIAFPLLLLAMLIVAVTGASLLTVTVAIGVSVSAIVARLTRVVAKRVLAQQYITAARTSGTGSLGIVWQHVLPNIWPTISVNLGLLFGVAVLAEASLSYLGLGAPPPNSSWGRLLQEAQSTVMTAPLGAIAPGVFLVILVIGVNLLVDGAARRLRPDPGARPMSAARCGGRPPGRPVPPDAAAAQAPLLEVASLSVTSPDGVARVKDVSFSVAPGERLGLIGESGSGKSLTAFAIIGLLPAGLAASGSILLDGTQVVGAPEKRLVPLRGRVCAFIFQEPLTALDPLMKLGRQLAEPIARHQGLRGADLRRAVLEALDEVRLPEPERIAESRPYEISGGQRQRVAIAMALACRPQLLIADEPTTALDVTVQSEVLALLDRLVADRRHGPHLREP